MKSADRKGQLCDSMDETEAPTLLCEIRGGLYLQSGARRIKDNQAEVDEN